MARPRVNQFADDLGISRREALNLINKGRRRKDGGSNVLENSMKKMKGYNEGGARRRSAKLTKEQKEALEALGYGDNAFDTLPLDMDDAQGAKGSGEKAYETYASGGAMKVKGYNEGGSNKIRRVPEEEKTFKLTEEEEREMLGSTLSDYKKAMHNKAFGDEARGSGGGRERAMETKAMGGSSMKVKGYSGGGMNCRGGGAAIKGTKFSGEF